MRDLLVIFEKFLWDCVLCVNVCMVWMVSKVLEVLLEFLVILFWFLWLIMCRWWFKIMIGIMIKGMISNIRFVSLVEV